MGTRIFTEDVWVTRFQMLSPDHAGWHDMQSRVLHLVPSSGFLPGSHRRLRHCDVGYAIRWLTTNAAAEQRRSLATYAVRKLTQLDGLTEAAEAQLLPHAAHTLRVACADP